VGGVLAAIEKRGGYANGHVHLGMHLVPKVSEIVVRAVCAGRLLLTGYTRVVIGQTGMVLHDNYPSLALVLRGGILIMKEIFLALKEGLASIFIFFSNIVPQGTRYC